MEKQNKVRMILASNIKRIRKEQKMTQEQLAELADISNTYVANIECGKTWVSDSTLEKITAALDVPIYDLFIPEEKTTLENNQNPLYLMNKVFTSKGKKLNTEINTLVKKTLKEIKDEINHISTQ